MAQMCFWEGMLSLEGRLRRGRHGDGFQSGFQRGNACGYLAECEKFGGGRNYFISLQSVSTARMAKSVDALVSGTSGRKAVQVRVLFRALKKTASAVFFSALLGTRSYRGP